MTTVEEEKTNNRFVLMNEKLDNIIEKIGDIKQTLTDHIDKEEILHKELSEGKADKEEVATVRNLIYLLYGGVFTFLLSLAIYSLTIK